KVCNAGVRLVENDHHRVVARRIRPDDRPLLGPEPRTPHMPDRHTLAIVVQIEAVKIDALRPLDEGDVQRLPGGQGESPAGHWLEHLVMDCRSVVLGHVRYSLPSIWRA